MSVSFLTREVFEHRLGEMRELMERECLNALAFQSPDYCYFASNFEIDVLVWERPIVVVIPMEGHPFAVLHELSANHIAMARDRGTLWLDDVVFYSEVPHLRSRLPMSEAWARLVAETLRARGVARGTIGVDTITPGFAEATARLRDLRLARVERELRALRLVKTDEELELARQAAGLTDWAQEQYRREIRAGRLVDDLDWSVGAMVMQEAADRFPGQSVKLRIMSLAGPESAAPHGSGAGAGSRIETGQSIVNVVIARLNGTTVENERTWICHSPSDAQRKAFAAVVSANSAAAAELRVGNPVAAVDAAALEVFVQHGLAQYVRHRTGHGMGIGHGGGLTAHDFPHDTAFETRPLLCGELYSVEPGIYLPGLGGFRHDDSVIVADEPEILTHTPRDLEAQIVDC